MHKAAKIFTSDKWILDSQFQSFGVLFLQDVCSIISENVELKNKQLKLLIFMDNLGPKYFFPPSPQTVRLEKTFPVSGCMLWVA